MQCEKHYSASAFEGTLEDAPSIAEGWSYYADAPTKFGYISNTTGSVLQITIPKYDEQQTTGSSNAVNPSLYVHYLRSYSPEWGKAEVNVTNMVATPTTIDSHTDQDASQLDLVKIGLKHSDEPYVVNIKNLGGKVKIVELFLYSCA